MIRKGINIHILDVCYPDFFSGHSLPVITIPANNQTKGELLEEIKNDDYANDAYTQEEIDAACANFMPDIENDVQIIGNNDHNNEEMTYLHIVIGVAVPSPIFIGRFSDIISGKYN